jgi:O-glycosyl hydrolase
MAFFGVVNGACGWINGRNVANVAEQNRVQTIAAATGSISADVDEVRVTYTATGSVTDIEYSDALKAKRKRQIVVYDAGGKAGLNNITIKDTANNVIAVIASDHGAVDLMCDGTNIDAVLVP